MTPRLSYTDICDLNTVTRMMDINRHPTGLLTLELADGPVDVPIRYGILHLIFWQIYARFGIPITRDHLYKTEGVFANKEIFGFLTLIYREIIKLRPDQGEDLKVAVWQTINYLQNFCVVELAEYQASISLRELVDILDEPAVQECTSLDLRPEMGTDVIEKMLENSKTKLTKLLGTRGALKNNVLLRYQEAGLLNENQIPQVLAALGLRTDINDVVVTYPVRSSAIHGMSSIVEMMVESLAARKSAYYNHEAIEKSQYFGRKQHLLASSIRRIYAGDCGTPLTVPFLITENNRTNTVGKYFKDPTTGGLTMLSKDNFDQYIGQTLELRSPMVCRYTDGICEVCGGELTKNIGPMLDIGILCAMHVIEPTTQKILSAKHLVKTKSLVYQLPTAARPTFVRVSNMLFWNEIIRTRDSPWWVGISSSDMGSLNDLRFIDPDTPIQEERFSSLKTLTIRNEKGETEELPLQVNKQCPHLAMEMLLYMKEHYTDIEMGENIIWVPMQGYPKQPVLRTVVVNDSMMAFVHSVTNFLAGAISKYRSVPHVLRDFSELVYDKVSTNLMHIEVLLKSYMVTNSMCYDVPVVSNPEDVRFSNTKKIITNRTVAGELAYEGTKKFLSASTTYTESRGQSVLDILFDL